MSFDEYDRCNICGVVVNRVYHTVHTQYHEKIDEFLSGFVSIQQSTVSDVPFIIENNTLKENIDKLQNIIDLRDTLIFKQNEKIQNLENIIGLRDSQIKELNNELDVVRTANGSFKENLTRCQEEIKKYDECLHKIHTLSEYRS